MTYEKIVTYGALVRDGKIKSRDEFVRDYAIKHESPAGGPAKFERPFAPDELLHAKIKGYQASHPGATYAAAMDAVRRDPKNKELIFEYAAQGNPTPFEKFDGSLGFVRSDR